MISPNQLEDFARVLSKHEALDEVLSRMSHRLYKKWVNANEEERRVIGDIEAACHLFRRELNHIVAEMQKGKLNE